MERGVDRCATEADRGHQWRGDAAVQLREPVSQRAMRPKVKVADVEKRSSLLRRRCLARKNGGRAEGLTKKVLRGLP